MKKVDLRIENAKIPVGKTVLEAGLAIENGRIAAIAKGDLLPESDEKLDLKGALLLPGIVDVHVHFRDPGLTHKEDFFTGSKAAAAGGVTTVCDMPNTSPMTDTLEAFEEKVKIAERKSLVDFGLHAALPELVEEGRELAEAGAASFKLYPELREDSEVPDFEEVGLTISIHPEDPEELDEQEGEGIDDFVKSRPGGAEVSEISKLLAMTSNAHLHLCHVTLRKSLDSIAKAKVERRITSEATPHHLLLSLSDFKKLGAIGKTIPPIRSEKDRKALLSALRGGIIDMVATDHAPHAREEKEESFADAPPGVVGVETSLPLIFTLVQRKKVSLFKLVETMCHSPARAFGLCNELGVPKGTLLPGSDADLVALDPKRKWKIRGKDLHGKTKLTPFEGREVIGKPILTMVRGRPVFRDGEIVGEEDYGRFIPRRT